MKTIEINTDIKADVEKVFEVFSELDKAVERITDLVKLEVLSSGPIGQGTRWKETRVMFGKEATEEMELTEFNPPEGYTAEAESHGAHYTSHFSFKPMEGGTRVTMSFQVTPLNFMAKVMYFLTGPLMAKTISKCMAKDMADLKSFLESNQA